MLDRPRITINPAPGFRPTFGPSRAREPGNGPGPQNSAGCTNKQLRRPIIRPIRGHFVFLGPTAKRFKKINDKFEATRGLPRVGQGGWLHCGLEAFVCSSSSSWPCRRVCWTDQGSRSIRPRVCGRLSAPRGPGSPGTAPAHKIAQVAPKISPGSKTKQNNHRHSPIQPSRVSGEHLCSNRSTPAQVSRSNEAHSIDADPRGAGNKKDDDHDQDRPHFWDDRSWSSGCRGHPHFSAVGRKWG